MKLRGKSAVELCEQAVHLLRSAPGTLALYYIGSMPFVLGFLFFWTDMSQSAFAYDRCAPASLGVAALYVWMCAWQAVFARELRAGLGGAPVEGSRARRLLQQGLAQAAIQPLKFVVLPAAALAALPFAGAYAFFHNAKAVGEVDSGAVAKTIRAARLQASLWPAQNWTLAGLLLAIGAVTFVNVAVALDTAPQLLRTLLGIETAFTRSAFLFLNTTFLAAAAGLTYLAVNPLAIAAYAVRCFEGESVATGEDLLADLKAGIAAGLVALALLCVSLAPAQPVAPAGSPPLPPAGSAAVQQLDRAIDQVVREPQFTWRLPRPVKERAESRNWFLRAVDGFLQWTRDRIDAARRTLRRVVEWIGDQLRGALGGGGNGGALSSLRLRLLLAALLAAASAALAWLLWNAWRERGRRAARVDAQIAAAPQHPARDEPRFDEQPAERWLQLAREYLARQESRLAVRALYLASLAFLAERALISIERGKSDRDYERELSRRARPTPEVAAAFARNRGLFERCWYGMYDVEAETIHEFERNFATMRTSAGN